MKLFRELTEDEAASFRAWARLSYKPMEPISGVWHPVVQDECVKINIEAGRNVNLPEMDDIAFAKLFR